MLRGREFRTAGIPVSLKRNIRIVQRTAGSKMQTKQQSITFLSGHKRTRRDTDTDSNVGFLLLPSSLLSS
jgi:hypothetical protein